MLTYNLSPLSECPTQTIPGQGGAGCCLRGAKPLFLIFPPSPAKKGLVRNKGANYPPAVSKGRKPFRGIFRRLDFDLRASFLRG